MGEGKEGMVIMCGRRKEGKVRCGGRNEGEVKV